MSEPSLRYAAFISYSHTNEREAARLHRALEGIRIPKDIAPPKSMPTKSGRIAPVFRDREELSSSCDLSASIRAALEASSALIVISSPAAQKSRWVNEEIKVYKRMHGEGRVYAFLIDGEPAEAFPTALLQRLGPDGELSDAEGEPLAADIRPGKDGWKIGTLKIAAGLLGVGLDALRQRELARERRRLMAATGLSLSVAVGALALTAWALWASNTAEKERARAEREALTAERTSEFMVKLFEVSDPGTALGETVTARAILDRGVASIEKDLKEEPRVQSELMYAMGRAFTGLGLYPDAARILSIARQKGVDAGADAIDQYAMENALARALFEKGDLDEAMAAYDRLVRTAEADMARGGWRVDYAVALTGLGETTRYQGSLEDAQKYSERARELLAAHGMNETAEMAEALRVLGGAEMFRGDFASADESLLRSKDLFLQIKGPNYYKLYVVESDIASLRYQQHRIDEAIKSASEAVRLKSKLLGPDHPETVISVNNLARLEFENGDLTSAMELMAKVLAGFHDAQLDQDPDFAFPLNSAGEIDTELGEYSSAVKYFERALAFARGNSARLVGPIKFNIGRAQCALKRQPLGLESVLAGREALWAHYQETDWRYGVADEFESRCRAALGEKENARALASSGYARLLEQLGPDHFFTKRAKEWMESLAP